MFKNTLILLIYFIHLTVNASASECQEDHGCDSIKLWDEASSSKTNREQLEQINKYVNNPLGWTALNYAIQEKDYEAASLIADYTTNLNKKNPLHANKKSRVKYNALSRLLHRAYYSWIYDKTAQSERQLALNDEQRALAHKLIDNGIKFDKLDSSAFTPICYCVFLGEKDLVAKLLDKGADIHVCYKGGGEILLSHAIASGQVDLAHYLIAQGANIQLIDFPGHDSMLHSAILSQKIELVELALGYGCDITQIDAIDIAVNYTWNEVNSLGENLQAPLPALEMIQFLLERGANPNFWVVEWVNKQGDFQKALRNSPLGKVMNLLDQPLSCHQVLYQQTLIKLLLDSGAVMP